MELRLRLDYEAHQRAGIGIGSAICIGGGFLFEGNPVARHMGGKRLISVSTKLRDGWEESPPERISKPELRWPSVPIFHGERPLTRPGGSFLGLSVFRVVAG